LFALPKPCWLFTCGDILLLDNAWIATAALSKADYRENQHLHFFT
jgi:hypothetical protein